MKKTIFILLLFILITPIYSQNYTISGYVEDLETGEKMISAYVFDDISGKGTVTNNFGFFSLTLPRDTVELKASYIGYNSLAKKFYLQKNTTLSFNLEPANNLKEIEITGDRVEKIEERTQMSKVEVPIMQIKTLPALFGEVDVLKTLQLLPGVQSGTEGTSGLYVRGGSPDQNLVLLDNVPVYNVSHILGIFSVFNADALKNVSITKGGFPARYGGRLSSILEINMKDGNMKKYHGNGSIGLITSKLMVEGPLVKDKASFIISGRRTYADILLRPIVRWAARQEGSNEKIKLKMYFYDLNAKVNYILNDKNRIYLSFYSGSDVFGSGYEYNRSSSVASSFYGGINWGNLITALRWNNQISPKLFMNTTLTYSDFQTVFLAEEKEVLKDTTNGFFVKYKSGIRDLAAKLDFDYIPSPNHYVKFGASYINHTYFPGAINFKIENNNFPVDTVLGYDKSKSSEFDLYAEDDFSIGQLKANIGLHLSGFKVNKEFYKSLQPRLGLRYLLNNGIALKGSFATMKQYINLLTSESISTPLDLWVPSTDKIKPQNSWQGALGLAKTYKNDYELSLEGYYKEMDNVISYRPGSSFFDEGVGEIDWENKVVQGKGQSYGLEFMVQKQRGKFSGWLAYTLSWNWRQFDGINNGEKYPFKYDRRHDFSIVGTYKFTDDIILSGSWIFSTGNAVTLPVYKYRIKPGYEIENNIKKNSFRMSNSHRLDISIEFHKKKKYWERAWVIGVYNAYFHKNPFFLYTEDIYEERPDGNYSRGKRVFKEVSILPFLPSISYQFKF